MVNQASFQIFYRHAGSLVDVHNFASWLTPPGALDLKGHGDRLRYAHVTDGDTAVAML
jgi:hypothetical protein